MFLETTELFPFLSVKSSSQSDLSPTFKLAFGLCRTGRSSREGSPSSLKLRLELLELQSRRRKAFNLETREITDFLNRGVS